MREQVLTWLSHQVPPARITHILGVEQMAQTLARHYDLDPLQAAQAGLMHDLAKYFPAPLLLEKATEAGLELDPVVVATPHLLHADVSALVAQEVFGVEDREVLAAIANHTLGRPGMGPLSCIVFMADALEPSRGDSSQLNHLRQLAFTNLYQALWLTCDYCLQFLLNSRHLIHPRTIATRNWALEEFKQRTKGAVPEQT